MLFLYSAHQKCPKSAKKSWTINLFYPSVLLILKFGKKISCSLWFYNLQSLNIRQVIQGWIPIHSSVQCHKPAAHEHVASLYTLMTVLTSMVWLKMWLSMDCGGKLIFSLIVFYPFIDWWKYHKTVRKQKNMRIWYTKLFMVFVRLFKI